MNNPKQLVDDRLIMLLYRIAQRDRQDTATVEEIKSFGLWAEITMNAALELGWLREKPEEILEITSEGREALNWALAFERTVVFGGSIPDQGTALNLIQPKTVNVWHLQKELTEEDFKPVLEAKPYESIYKPMKTGFPGLRYYGITLVHGENHPLAGLEIDPGGYPGMYLVTVILRRQGAPDNPKSVQLDAQLMEGDSHLHFPESFVEKTAEKQPLFMKISERSSNGDLVEFLFVPNKWQRLGKIMVPLEAKNYEEAFDKAHQTLVSILCDLSYRYDVPLDILQVNVVEKTTLTHRAQKMADYPEARLDEHPFGKEGMDYSALPLYTTLTYLYQEGLNSSSVNYSFLCFYKVIEGIRKMREQRSANGEHRRYSNEKVEGAITQHFPEKFHNKKFSYVIDEMLLPTRNRIAHAFLDKDGPDIEQYDSLEKRLKLEREVSSYRVQAREIVRVMMQNEYWEAPQRAD